MYKLTPDQVIAQMSQLTAGKANRNDQNIYVAVVMKADPSWEKIGQLEKKQFSSLTKKHQIKLMLFLFNAKHNIQKYCNPELSSTFTDTLVIITAFNVVY